MREITREIVSAVIFTADGKILLGKKDPDKGGVYANCWHIPGGGVEGGEDKISALIREVKEETGLVINKTMITLLDNKGHGQSEKVLKSTGERVLCRMNFHVYKVALAEKSAEIKLIPASDLPELKWFSLQETAEIQLTPPGIELFTRLGYLKLNRKKM